MSVLYLLAAAVLPVLHAETETLITTRSVEQHHTSQCGRIHSDLSCPATGAVRALPVAGAPKLRAPTAALVRYRPPSSAEPARPDAVGTPRARGPPQA